MAAHQPQPTVQRDRALVEHHCQTALNPTLHVYLQSKLFVNASMSVTRHATRRVAYGSLCRCYGRYYVCVGVLGTQITVGKVINLYMNTSSTDRNKLAEHMADRKKGP